MSISDNNDNSALVGKPDNSLSQQYSMQSACHTHSIFRVFTKLDFLTHNFQASVISTLNCVSLALKIHNVFENMLRNSMVRYIVR